MGVILRQCFIPILTLFAFFLLFSSSAATSLHRFNEGLGKEKKETARSGLPGWVVDQKRLGGPGSVPPICTLKCGKCKPCKAVLVPIQPGLVMPLEYYPEPWRCKCGNKFFMP